MSSNLIVLVGRLVEITRTELVIKLAGEEDIIPVTVSKNLLDNVTAYSQIGDIMGVKGKIKNQDGRVIIEGDKISFLSRKTEGGE